MYSGIGGETTKKRDQKKMKRAAGVVEIHLRRSLSAANDQLHTKRVGTEAGWCANYYIVVFFLFFPPPRDDVGFCVYTIYKPQTHTQTYSTFVEWCAHVTKSVEKKFSKHFFFFCFLWFLSLSPPFYCYDYLGSRCVYGSARLSGAGNVSERPLFTQPLP